MTRAAQRIRQASTSTWWENSSKTFFTVKLSPIVVGGRLQPSHEHYRPNGYRWNISLCLSGRCFFIGRYFCSYFLNQERVFISLIQLFSASNAHPTFSFFFAAWSIFELHLQQCRTIEWYFVLQWSHGDSPSQMENDWECSRHKIQI